MIGLPQIGDVGGARLNMVVHMFDEHNACVFGCRMDSDGRGIARMKADARKERRLRNGFLRTHQIVNTVIVQILYLAKRL